MPDNGMARLLSKPMAFSAVNTLASCTQIAMGERAGGLIHIVSLSSGSTAVIKFYSIPDTAAASTSYILRDKDNADIAITVEAGKCYPLPDELFAARSFRIYVTTNITVTGTLVLKT